MAKNISANANKENKGKKGNEEEERKDGFDVTTGKLRLPLHLQTLLKQYEANCEAANMSVFLPIKRELKACKEDEKALVKVIFNPQKDRKEVMEFEDAAAIIQKQEEMMEGKTKDSPTSPIPFPSSVVDENKKPTKLSRLVEALRCTYYTYIEILCTWGIHIDEEESAILSELIRAGKGKYPIRILCLFDCLIIPPSIGRIAKTFNVNLNLSEVYLDFNNFGDEGCTLLAQGMEHNKTIVLLSMRYCELTSACGMDIGNIIKTTPVQDIRLDGNSLGVVGLIMILDPLINFLRDIEETGDPRIELEKLKKERIKQMRKKKITYKEWPPKWPVVSKITLADNKITHQSAGKGIHSMLAFKLLANYIEKSTDIQEVDLWGNNVGETAAMLFIDSLQKRKIAKLKPIGFLVGPSLSHSSVARIASLAPGPPKSKKDKKKQNKFFE